MKHKFILNLLGFYELMLSLGAISTGINMISGKGVFNEFPQEWLLKVPFHNWFLPGIIGIIIFGFGNIIAAILSFRKKGKMSWLVSTIMASIFFLSMIAQYKIFGEHYLPADMLFGFSIIQVFLCGLAIMSSTKAVFINKRL